MPWWSKPTAVTSIVYDKVTDGRCFKCNLMATHICWCYTPLNLMSSGFIPSFPVREDTVALHRPFSLHFTRGREEAVAWLNGCYSLFVVAHSFEAVGDIRISIFYRRMSSLMLRRLIMAYFWILIAKHYGQSLFPSPISGGPNRQVHLGVLHTIATMFPQGPQILNRLLQSFSFFFRGIFWKHINSIQFYKTIGIKAT